MTTGQLIFIVAIILFILVLLLFPEVRALFKGFVRLFVKDMAATPEGAEAIYSEKIEQAQEAYNKADDALKMQSGRLKTASDDLEALKKRLKKVESECESLVASGKLDMAGLKAEEREEVLSDIERAEKLVKAYQESTAAAKDVYEKCEKNLTKLKRESKEVVENMRTNKQLKEAYDDINELKNVTAADKTLEYVREKSKDLDAMAAGSKVVHDSKLSTKLEKAEAEAKKSQTNDYLESLKKKYNK